MTSRRIQVKSPQSNRSCRLVCPLWQIVLVAVAELLVSVGPCQAADPCDSDWFYMYNENERAGKCYYVSNSERTFNNSVRRCQDNGAQLASLATEEENDFIRSLFEDPKKADTTAQDYWLGIYREQDDSSNNLRDGWVWLDGTKFNWVNWHSGEPDSGERCGRLRTYSNYDWAGQKCSDPYGCICEKAATTSDPSPTSPTSTTTASTTSTTDSTTTTASGTTTFSSRSATSTNATATGQTTTEKAADRCHPDWYYNENEGSGKCYYVSNAERNFPDAASWCQRDGGQLVSIADEEEHKYIRKLLEGRAELGRITGYWLGMYREAIYRDSWVWLDETDFNWTNWIIGEPVDATSCARLVTSSNFQWAASVCTENLGLICEMGAGMATTVTAMTTTVGSTGPNTLTYGHTERMTSILDRPDKSTATDSALTTSSNGDTKEETNKKEDALDSSALIGIGVAGWCLCVVIILVVVAYLVLKKRRQRKHRAETNSNPDRKSVEADDYEQVVDPTVSEAATVQQPPVRDEPPSGQTTIATGQTQMSGTDSTRDTIQYENPPTTSAIQHHSTRSDDSCDRSSEDMTRAQYESLQGGEGDARGGHTYTSLAPAANNLS